MTCNTKFQRHLAKGLLKIIQLKKKSSFISGYELNKTSYLYYGFLFFFS